jgi:hypothetical protein
VGRGALTCLGDEAHQAVQRMEGHLHNRARRRVKLDHTVPALPATSPDPAEMQQLQPETAPAEVTPMLPQLRGRRRRERTREMVLCDTLISEYTATHELHREETPQPPAQHSMSRFEQSLRTATGKETGAAAWSVDYPDELAAEVRANNKSNAVIAGLPEMHVTVRRLRPSAKVLAQDRLNRDITYRILSRAQLQQTGSTPTDPRRMLQQQQSTTPVPSGVALAARLPMIAPPRVSKTPIPAHGQSPRRHVHQ